MVVEIYKICDGEEDTNIFFAFQTITMRVIRIARKDRFEQWMLEQGLTPERGWNLDDAFEKSIEDYNEIYRQN
jgi:ASC-1-like (ASCH) protein